MTLTIIAGTHSFIDLTGRFRQAYLRSMQNRIKYTINGVTFWKKRFDRVDITKEGKVIHEPSRLFPMDRNGLWWSVSQPTGSGKTILAVYDMQRTHTRGGRVEGNLSYQHFPHNEGKSPEEWLPSVRTIEDLQKLRGCHCVIDDIKGTISSWQAKEADIITLTSNTGRKESVDLTFTTQRVINYMPPNIRAVATGYEIPYITVRDGRISTPDNKGFPVEMEVFSLIPGDSGDIFVGFGVLNKDIPNGRVITPTFELLNSYRTMELATGLKVNKEEVTLKEPIKEIYSGLNTELVVYNDLMRYAGTLRHLSYENPNKHDTDILYNNGKRLIRIDAVSCRTHGGYDELQTAHKDLTRFNNDYENRKVAFVWHGAVKYLDVKHLLGIKGNARLTKNLRIKMSSGDKIFDKLEV
jgi:hypothetical protein